MPLKKTIQVNRSSDINISGVMRKEYDCTNAPRKRNDRKTTLKISHIHFADYPARLPFQMNCFSVFHSKADTHQGAEKLR